MNRNIIKIIIFLGIIFTFFLNANFISALEINYPDIFGQSLDNTSTLSNYICYLFGLITYLSFSITVIVIAFGGIYYLISYGKGKFTNEGKDWIKAGILGFLIIICSSLIISTINPGLSTCQFGLLPLNFLNPFGPSPLSPDVDVITYNEIPIGTLTENLLTRTTMDCYGFDQDGNPVDGDNGGPTYINHDRVDCLSQLVDGAQKKNRHIDALSDEITKLMNKCSCEGKCDPDAGCKNPTTTSCPNSSGSCEPPSPPSCSQPEGTNDCCPPVATDPDGNPLPISVKDQIEHGPIVVSIDIGSGSGDTCSDDSYCSNDETCDPKTGKCDCKTRAVEYNGLDEFRCPSDCSGIVGLVETLEEINGRMVTVINQEKWNNLNLIQQLTYFKEKIDNWPEDSKIRADLTELQRAKSTLGNCYLVIPYIDLVKTYESADKQKLIILKDPEKFYDPETGPINVAKYCQGFNYADSNCLKQCNDACPDASYPAMQLYQPCPNCEDDEIPFCLNNQEMCIETAYNFRPCIYGEDTSQNFGECISSCQNNCINNCNKKYFKCSSEYKSCKSKCEDDSQCFFDNGSSCAFGAMGFINCANQYTDQGNADYCINNAYLCKNGSDNYFGSTSLSCPRCPCTTAGTQCNEYSYNDDPLTFYCEDNWWNNPNRDEINMPEPIGIDRVIELETEGEIPVGRTVDDAENWAIGLIKTANKISEEIQKTLDLMTKIGKAETTDPVQDYCKCNAKLETGDAICKTDCKYNQYEECNPDDDTDCWWNCVCDFVPCKGNPCKQIIDWLSQLKTNYTEPADGRSEIIKELAYSRKTINDCSLTGSTHGLLETRLLSCTRIEDEIIPPIGTYCYGIQLGNLSNKSLTDNWFCTQKYSKSIKQPSNNPLYNK